MGNQVGYNQTAGHAEVLVIGAGASGAITSRHLAESGFDVVCLEQGDWVNAAEYPGDKPEWELLAQKSWHPNPNVRGRPADYPCETSDSDVNPLMFAGVGGSTILWAGHWCRQAPSDFRVRSLDGVADDWPLTYEDLLPFYEKVEKALGVSGMAGDPAYPKSKDYPLPALPINQMGRLAAQGMNELGWHWWPAANAIPSQAAGNQAQCVRYGTCMTGCPEGSKASTDITHWPMALEHGARLVTGARVSEVSVNADGLATGALFLDRQGNEHRQTADVVVICANGMGTARLLLMSSSSRFPDGLANTSGLVGKRLMLHPKAAVVGVYEEDLQSWIGPSGQMIQSMQFYETNPTQDYVRGAKWAVMPTGGPLTVAANYSGRPIDQRWGEAHHRNLKEAFGHSFEWGIIAEDLPEESNHVSLDPSLRDSDNLPAPKVTYRNSENTRKLLDFHIERAKAAHEAAGATSTMVTTLVRDSGWHLLGTCRMGEDPATSVVNQYGRSHDIPNLYVYDGSVFPTSSGVNPTATICAVAQRAVENLVVEARNQVVPS